jgi:hypothetical protein
MTAMEKRVPQSHTEFMSLSALANGCQAISWFMFHDRDGWGDAPVSELGHRRENHAALANVNAVVKSTVKWNDLAPVTDLAIAYYRPYMWHCHLGDPSPCNDGELHVGAPVLWGVQAGASAREFEGVFRVVQQAGYTAGCVDLTDAPERLGDHGLVWLAAEPFMEPDTAKILREYVASGGTLVVSLAWPTRNLRGGALDFLSVAHPDHNAKRFGVTRLGEGRILWCPGAIGDCDPGCEDLAVVGEVRSVLKEQMGPPAVDVTTEPVRWMTWKDGGGAQWKVEPHNLVDAILHEGGGERLLYVANVHERAVRATVRFAAVKAGRLVQLGGERACVDVVDGKALVAIDRKSTFVYRLTE